MGFMYTATVYVAGYLIVMFVAICLACGLYFLAELAEEHRGSPERSSAAQSSWFVTRRHACTRAQSEDRPRTRATGAGVTRALLRHRAGTAEGGAGHGFAAHCLRLALRDLPDAQVLSPSFLASIALLVASQYLWVTHFTAHFHQASHVACFFVLMCWLVPFGFFISLSFNETVLPNRQAQDADDVYAEGGRTQKKSGLVSAFNFLGEKRDDLMPSMTKQV